MCNIIDMQKCKSAGFSLPAELMDQIDKERGDIGRSKFILRLIQKARTKEDCTSYKSAVSEAKN
jgi:metal-responsive CopG/Arc/MetJ family transcriptional regulator